MIATLNMAVALSTVVNMLPNEVLAAPGNVKVETDILGVVYTWKVTNIDALPIIRFEIPRHSALLGQVPEGWQLMDSADHFVATTTDRASAIRKGRTKSFASRAPTLSSVPASSRGLIQFSDGTTEVINDLWIPRDEAVTTRLIPPATIIAIVALHVLLRGRKKRHPKQGELPEE